MRKPAILITGANGEIGHGLITALHKKIPVNIITLDLNQLDGSISGLASDELTGSILDVKLIDQLNGEYEFDTIYHLAAQLSTRAEFSPRAAHDVNVGGTINLLNLALEQGRSQGKQIKFFFPSSIAVYGLKNLKEKVSAGAIKENTYKNPYTIYGCNKLYCENLGTYFSKYSEQINNLDFRSIRFSGIISAESLPQGGTSDYAPEMIHNAIQNKNYTCFVRPDSCIPFMVMPDAINAIIALMTVSKEKLTKDVYHIQAFSPTVQDIYNKLILKFPKFKLNYNVNSNRQGLIDSWPSILDQSRACKDWGWNPNYDFDTIYTPLKKENTFLKFYTNTLYF